MKKVVLTVAAVALAWFLYKKYKEKASEAPQKESSAPGLGDKPNMMDKSGTGGVSKPAAATSPKPGGAQKPVSKPAKTPAPTRPEGPCPPGKTWKLTKSTGGSPYWACMK